MHRCRPVPESPICAPVTKGRAFPGRRCAHGAAHACATFSIGLEIGVRTRRAEALDGAHNDARIDSMDAFPTEAEAVKDAGAEVLHHDVALLE